jgi:hypothetical protein
LHLLTVSESTVKLAKLRRNPIMKKLMSVLLGLSLVIGSASIAFGDDSPKKEKKQKKAGKKKNTTKKEG